MSIAGKCMLTQEVNWAAWISSGRFAVFVLPVMRSAYFRDQCDLRVHRARQVPSYETQPLEQPSEWQGIECLHAFEL